MYSGNSGRIALNSEPRGARRAVEEEVEEISSVRSPPRDSNRWQISVSGKLNARNEFLRPNFQRPRRGARSIKCFCLRSRVQRTVGNKAVINARGKLKSWAFRAFEVNSRHKQTLYFHLPRV